MKQYTCSERRLIERIIPVAKFNEGKKSIDQINCKYGYVMPVYGGGHWKRTKKELISIYL